MSDPTSKVQIQEPEVQITRSEKTYKPKDPRRVQAGKRLAAISKSAKEKKARDRAAERSQGPAPAKQQSRSSGQSPADDTGSDWVLPVGGIIAVGLGGLYYAYSKRGQTKTSDVSQASVSSPKALSKPQQSQLDSFDE